jgi:hypothetical protein
MQNGTRTWPNVAIPCKMQSDHAKMQQIPCKTTGSSSKLLQIQGKWYRERKPNKNPKPEAKKKSKTYSTPKQNITRLTHGPHGSWRHRGARASHDFLFGLPVPGQSVDPSTCHTAVSSWPWLGNLRSKARFFPSEDPKVILKTLEYLGFFRKFLGSTWFDCSTRKMSELRIP